MMRRHQHMMTDVSRCEDNRRVGGYMTKTQPTGNPATVQRDLYTYRILCILHFQSFEIRKRLHIEQRELGIAVYPRTEKLLCTQTSMHTT